MTEPVATTETDAASRAVVDHKLRDAWHKERRFHHARGLCFLLVWSAALIVVDLLIDWLFLASYRAPGWGVLVLLGINVVTLAAVLHHYWWRHLRRYDPVRLALQIEGRHPELQSLLVSYVQIDDRLEAETRASHGLVMALRRRAVARTRPIDFREVVNFRVLARLFVFSLAVVGLFAAISAYKSEFFHTLIRRMLNPVARIEYPTATVIERVSGDMTVRQGAAVVISAVCSGELPEKGTLHVKSDEGDWESLTLLPQRPGGAVFAYRLAEPRASFDYYVTANDDESARHRVTVVPAPKVVAKRITLTYPKYTGLEPRQQDSYYVEVPEGTRVRWRMQLDRPVESVTMIRNRTDEAELTVSQAGRLVEAEATADEPFEYRFRWRIAHHRFVYESAGSYMVNVLPDTPPEVEILEPVRDEKATVRKRLSVTFRARDDYGCAAARLVYAVGDGPERTWEIAEMSGKTPTKSVQKKLAELVAGLKEEDVITYCVEVADNRAGPSGPNVSRSGKRRVYVVSIAEYLRGILEEQMHWVSEVRELRVEERTASEKVGAMKNTETQPATQPSNE